MKKNALLLGMLISLFFACSSDDNEPATINPVGTYTLTSAKTSVPIDSNANGNFDDTELIDNVGCSPKIILNSDKTFVIEDSSIYQPASWGTGGVSKQPVTCEIYSTIDGSYSITDGSLIFNSNDGEGSIIFSISENKITRTQQDFYFTSSTATQPSSISITYTYTK